MVEEKVADHIKKWVVDDYIIVPPDIQWKRLPNIMERIEVMNKKTRKYEFKEVARQFLNKDDKKYQTMIKMVLDSREKFDDDNLTQLFYRMEGQHTCRWCHEHWMGSGGYISLPSSKENFLKWELVYSQSPTEIADLMQRKTKQTRLDTLGEKLEKNDHISLAFWEMEQVKSVCTYVMHELHPENVHFYLHQEEEPIETYSIRFDHSSRFLVVIVLERRICEHFSHYVFDLERGSCDVMDPTFYGEEEIYNKSLQERTHAKVS